MTRVATVEAPAKVNLFLRVLGRRPDGFHEIETLFQAVSLCDRVTVSLDEGFDSSGSIALDVDGPDLGPPEANLAYRAARAFQVRSGFDTPVRLHLVKRIPAGAGLGGGSSDAAAVLKCLAALSGFHDPEALHDMASDLGSDVPFFLAPSPLALGRGRGEDVTALVALPEAALVLALPDVHVATAAAYGELAACREHGGPERGSAHGPSPSTLWDDEIDEWSWGAVAAFATNDFEPIVAAAHSEVQASIEGLRERGARFAMLSGSGAASFGLFSDPAEARTAAAWLEGRHPWGFVPAATLTAMPVPRVTESGNRGTRS